MRKLLFSNEKPGGQRAWEWELSALLGTNEVGSMKCKKAFNWGSLGKTRRAWWYFFKALFASLWAL